MFPFSQNCEINILNRSILGYIIFVQQFFLLFFLNAICWTRLKLDTAKPKLDQAMAKLKLKTEQVAELTELETELMTEVEVVVMADNKVTDPILLSFLNTRKKAGRAH